MSEADEARYAANAALEDMRHAVAEGRHVAIEINDATIAFIQVVKHLLRAKYHVVKQLEFLRSADQFMSEILEGTMDVDMLIVQNNVRSVIGKVDDFDSHMQFILEGTEKRQRVVAEVRKAVLNPINTMMDNAYEKFREWATRL